MISHRWKPHQMGSGERVFLLWVRSFVSSFVVSFACSLFHHHRFRFHFQSRNSNKKPFIENNKISFYICPPSSLAMDRCRRYHCHCHCCSLPHSIYWNLCHVFFASYTIIWLCSIECYGSSRTLTCWIVWHYWLNCRNIKPMPLSIVFRKRTHAYIPSRFRQSWLNLYLYWILGNGHVQSSYTICILKWLVVVVYFFHKIISSSFSLL